jgi:hypothetical protein
MLEKVLRELQKEGIKALEYADECLRQAKEQGNKGNTESAELLVMQCHAHRDTALTLAWVYSRTMDGVSSIDIVDLWNNTRKGLTQKEIVELCGIGLYTGGELE